ncbi:hypothetical protein [Paenibacillus sp. MBLB4367]|uniref:hypothetical protein n=1 Tax=Paenibacillus sp. MBLB4367 TaxID=3384767 RepID=UPI0039083A9B
MSRPMTRDEHCRRLRKAAYELAAKHGIDKDGFLRAVDAYEREPELLNKIGELERGVKQVVRALIGNQEGEQG